jgi:peptidoglycan/xylan/chitin deacetylase (PgdA/CDA1 family)
MKNKNGRIILLHDCRPAEPAAVPFVQDASLRVNPEFLEQTICNLLASGHRFISLDEFIENKNNKTGNELDVVISIDDGYRGIYMYAFPLFKKYNIPFVFYVSTNFIDFGFDRCWNLEADGMHIVWDILAKSTGTVADKRAQCEKIIVEYRQKKPNYSSGYKLLSDILDCGGIDFDAYHKKYFCSWNELREMSQSSLCTIGSHSLTHRPLATLTKDDIDTELRESRAKIELELGKECLHFCYPYGSYNGIANELVHKYYRSAVLVYLNLHNLRRDVLYSDDNYNMPRLSLSSEYGHFFLEDFYMIPILRDPRFAGFIARLTKLLYNIKHLGGVV